MSTATGRRKQLLLAAVVVSAISIAIGSGRQKSSLAISPAPAKPATTVNPSRRKMIARLVIRSTTALLVLAFDAWLLWQAGDVTSTAIGATAVGIGATLVLLADTDAMGLSKRDWRKWAKPLGNIFVALGGGVLVLAAWQIFFRANPWPWG
jgi:hypothetical protein